MSAADGQAEFVATLPTPPRVGRWFTVGAVLLGSVVAVGVFHRHPLTALTLVALGASSVWHRRRSPLVVAVAVLLHSATVGIVSFIDAVGSTADGQWWDTMPLPPGTVALLGVLTAGLLVSRANRAGPALSVLLMSMGTVLAAAGALPDGLVGMDVGTLLATIAVADRTA